MWVAPDIDRSRIQVRLDMRRIKFFDHLDARATVLCDLVYIRALHQAQTNISMAEAIGGDCVIHILEGNR